MGITGLIGLFIFALLLAMVYFVVQGIRQKNRKMIVFPIVAFIVIVGGIYWGLLCLITSM